MVSRSGDPDSSSVNPDGSSPQLRRHGERILAIQKILSELESLEFSANMYYEDPGYANAINAFLGSRLQSLILHLNKVGLSEIASELLAALNENDDALHARDQLSLYFIPEIRSCLNESIEPIHDEVVHRNHPEIESLVRSRLKAGHFADAVEAAAKHFNARVKRIVRERTGQELDGAALMYKAFSVKAPVILLDDLSTETGRSRQQGYMELAAGMILAIRNPKAHDNIDISEARALRFLNLISLLMDVVDEQFSPDTE